MRVKTIGSNQIEILKGDITILVSYETPVACNVAGEGFYRTEKKYSVTTSRHINQWLDGAKASTRPQEYFDKLLG